MSTTSNLGLPKPPVGTGRGGAGWANYWYQLCDLIDAYIGAAKGSAASIAARLNVELTSSGKAKAAGARASLAEFLLEGHNTDGTHKSAISASEWVTSDHTPVYVSADTFRIESMDVTEIYSAGRRLNLYYGDADHFMSVVSATLNGSDTDIEVDGAVPNPMDGVQVSYSIVSGDSIPRISTGDTTIDGSLFASENVNCGIAASRTVTEATCAVDMSAEAVQPVVLDNSSIAFSVSNISAFYARSITVVLTAIDQPCNMTFDANWYWMNAKPTTLQTTEKGILSLLNVGPAAADIIASFSYVTQ